MKLTHKLLPVLYILLVSLGLSGCIKKTKTNYPLVKSGFVDLSGWDFESEGIVTLNGEWEFYWGSLLTPSDFKLKNNPEKTGFFQFPGLWEGNSVNNTRLSATGHATYRLRANVKPDLPMALYLSFPLSVCKIWVNGKFVSQSGETGRSKDLEKPQKYFADLHFLSTDGQLDMIIQISNYHNITGGPFKPVLVGTEKDIYNFIGNKIITSTLLTSTIFILFLFNIFQYLVRRPDKANLYLGLYCLMISITSALGDGGISFIIFLFPTMPWELSLNLLLSLNGLSIPFLIMFYHSLYPHNLSKHVERFYQVLGGLFILYILCTPTNAFDKTQFLFRIVMLTCVPYLFTRFVADYKRRAEGINILIPAYLIFIFSIINDILHDLEIIDTTELIQYSTIFLALSYSLLIPIRLSRAYSSVKALSSELEEKNISLLKSNAIKDQFLANTSHELRTPLNGIIGIAESLIQGAYGQLKTQVIENLQIISSGGRRLSGLINDILDFSVVREGKINLTIKALDLRSVVDTVLTSTRILALEKGLELVNDVPPAAQYVYADAERLQQILFNLVGNAIKFTKQGTIKVTATSGKKKTTISVVDTGIGIAPEKISSVFESFVQLDEKSTTRHQGIGLGLSITKYLVELHGGKISVKSEPGKGATFLFTLERCEATIEQTEGITTEITSIDYLTRQKQIESSNQLTVGNSTSYILVVDDDSGNLQVVCNYLIFLKLEVVTCENGQQALDTIKKHGQPTLVLLDIMMPDMTGYEVCKKIRKDYIPSELPIILLTAKTAQTDIVEGFESGANDYLVKPFSGEELLARVKSQLQLRESYQTLAENIRLREELVRRQETERDLLLMQRRLSVLLDTVEDAVLAVNQSEEITFCNHSCASFLAYETDQLLGRSIWSVIKPDKKKQLSFMCDQVSESGSKSINGVSFIKGDQSALSANLVVTTLELEDEVLSVLLLRNRKTENQLEDVSIVNTKTLKLISELNHNQKRLRTLEESLNGLLPGIVRKVPTFQTELKAIDSALAQVSESLLSPEKRVDRNQLAVSVMLLCIQYWNLATGTDKFELARQSGLWKVYTNEDGWERTQTLDRYLDLTTLPEKPRWKMVISTAEFVLNCCTETSQVRNHLVSTLTEFRLACP